MDKEPVNRFTAPKPKYGITIRVPGELASRIKAARKIANQLDRTFSLNDLMIDALTRVITGVERELTALANANKTTISKGVVEPTVATHGICGRRFAQKKAEEK